MKIKNLTAKPIGFGPVIILPDQTGETPKGYGKEHPTVKYYLSRGWIKEVGAPAVKTQTPVSPVNVQVGINTGGAGSDYGKGTEKPLDRMNKDELLAIAAAMGLEAAENDTNKILIEKIKAAKNNAGE